MLTAVAIGAAAWGGLSVLVALGVGRWFRWLRDV
jgi:hypothetical protein